MTLARDEDRTPPPTSAVKPPVQFVTFEAMLPAAMALLGRWNWWAPAVLRRRQPLPETAPGELVGV